VRELLRNLARYFLIPALLPCCLADRDVITLFAGRLVLLVLADVRIAFV
jgi:hypothetical protein